MPEATLFSRITAPLGQIADFGGRSRRANYWPYILLLLAIYIVGTSAFVLSDLAFGFFLPMPSLFGLVGILVLLAFAATVRRLHDVGWSGRWMAAYVLMTLAFIVFVFCLRYSVVRHPYGGEPSALIRFMPLMMFFGLAQNGLGLLIFVLSVLDGNVGTNRYGPDPKGRSAP